MSRSLVGVIALALSLVLVGCKPLRGTPGALEFGPAPHADAIPASWGRVVAVTPNASNPDLVQIWLEQEDRSLAVLWFDYVRGEITQSLAIPRR